MKSANGETQAMGLCVSCIYRHHKCVFKLENTDQEKLKAPAVERAAGATASTLSQARCMRPLAVLASCTHAQDIAGLN